MAEVPWGLRAWMVVVIVGRELLVTALRSFIEDRGSDFSAKMSGKLKMVLQCVAAGACLFYLSYDAPQTQTCGRLVLVAAGGVRLVGGGLDGLLRRGLHPRRGAIVAGVELACDCLAARFLACTPLPDQPCREPDTRPQPSVSRSRPACVAWSVGWSAAVGGSGGPSLPYQPRRPVPWHAIDLAGDPLSTS